MKKLFVFAFAVVLAAGLAGCKGGDEVEKNEENIPDCDFVCRHAFDLELSAASDKEKNDYKQEKDEYFKDCNESCESRMDDEAKKCVVSAKAAADLKACKKEARKRAKAAKGEKKEEKKPEEKPEEK